MIAQKKILVTGGAGFIGSGLCARLIENGNEVFCLDNLLTGKKQNIEGLRSNPSFHFIEADIRDAVACNDAVKGMDVVLHQAALGSVPRSINDPVTTNQINIDGFLNVINAVKVNGVKRFVYASSSSVYGDSQQMPKVESCIGKPLSPYAVTKYVNEVYAGVFADLYGIEVIGLRYFNVFGRHQDPDGMYAAAIPKFIKAMMKGEPVQIYGDGSQTRDFTYIENVIQANLLAASTTNKEAFNQVYNVAAGARTALLDLIIQLKALIPGGAKSEIVFAPVRPGEVQHSFASIDKAKRILGYQPSHQLSDGLKEAVEWYLENL